MPLITREDGASEYVAIKSPMLFTIKNHLVIAGDHASALIAYNRDSGEPLLRLDDIISRITSGHISVELQSPNLPGIPAASKVIVTCSAEDWIEHYSDKHRDGTATGIFVLARRE